MDADVTIIGMGPAGLQAAIHSSRKKAKTLVLGKMENSAIYPTELENYLGYRGGSGKELLASGAEQARSFGASLLQEDVISVEKAEGGFILRLESGKEVKSKALVFAPGISRKKLNIPGEKEFFGKGVSYCATCDCNFYKEKPVAIIGEASEAASSAELMTHYASKVYWVAKELKANQNMVDMALGAGANLVQSQPKTVRGDQKVTGLELEDGTVLEVNGVFIELGSRSSADLAMDVGVLPDPEGHLKVDEECGTGVEGVFACGDITGKPWQLARAVGQGAVAGLNAASYARSG
ncbi:MAG: FAD-dependent oxidoreductase [Candidatus Methanomethylophilaceae archaeon]|nr:FAD-dependent oxidoreductase [Candidatus Methanomethylophilaceae archaeon]